MTDQKNTILAIVLSGLVLLAWQYFVGMPQMEKQRQAQQQQQQQQQAQQQEQKDQKQQQAKPDEKKDEKQAAAAKKEAPREIDKQDAEAVLDALERVEPTVQKELARRRAGNRRPTKDW